jgi:dTDP-4-dehydrorhamnose reductase
MTILVFGGHGQLGQCLQELAHEHPAYTFIFLDQATGDILDKPALRSLFRDHQPAYCVNCAAYTAVDKAEDDPETAGKVNRDGAANLAALCAEFSSILIHISTDFVFAGTSPQPLTETDPAQPVSVYGLTKLQGEAEIQALTERYFILRTSWLYSEFAANFVKTMLRLGAERDKLNVIADQVGTPTYAMDLAGCILEIIRSGTNRYGIYHYSNEGVTSWYDFAKAIFDIAGVSVSVLPVRTSEYVTRAVRPAFSVMDKRKIKDALGLEIPYWRDSLSSCIRRMQSQRPEVS